MRTLVLNQWYKPISIKSWEYAITAWFIGRCEMIEEYPDTAVHPKLSIGVPAVVRQVRSHKLRTRSVRFSKHNVYVRDDGQCQYCGTQLSKNRVAFDHVIPRTNGGDTTWENLVTSCRPCNWQKGAGTPEQAGLKLMQYPVRPRALPISRMTWSDHMPELWRKWLLY